MKKNSIFVPSLYVYEKFIGFYSKSVPSKFMKEKFINVPSIHFQIVGIKIILMLKQNILFFIQYLILQGNTYHTNV